MISRIETPIDSPQKPWKAALQDVAGSIDHEGHAFSNDQDSRFGECSIRLQSTTSLNKLHEQSARLGLSCPAAFFRAAWGFVLSETLEAEEVAISEAYAGAELPNVSSLTLSKSPIMFRRQASTLAVLMELDGLATEGNVDRFVEDSIPESIPDQASLAQTKSFAFAYHATTACGTDVMSKAHLQRNSRFWASCGIKHLALDVWRTHAGHATLELTVAESLFAHDDHELLLKQVDAIVGAMVENVDDTIHSLIGRLPLELISKTTPRPGTACPSTLHPAHWVEHYAKCHPEWNAVEIITRLDATSSETEVWTYAELDAQANRIAETLLKDGIHGRMIGMCLGRTLVSFAVILAIWKSGNAYLPVEDSLPGQRKALLLEDSDAAVVFASKSMIEDVLLPPGCRLIDVESRDFLESLTSTQPQQFVPRGAPSDSAYLLYTSGSTGKPKGCLISQQNLSSFVEAQSEFICTNVPASKTLGGRGKYLCLASRAFDVHIGEMTLAWRHGYTAITAPRSMLLDGLGTVLSTLHITHASFVPSLLDQTGLTPEDTPELVFLLSGGEKMSARVKKDWASHERIGLVNAYGPTEVTIGCCSARIYRDSDMRNIGTPLGDSVAHVLIPETYDYALRGMPGELCFTGSLVGTGYYRRPDAKGFVDDFNGERMYRTGDTVELRPNGDIHYLQRKDDQVKIRGQRVELGEVSEGVRMTSEEPIDTAALVLKHPDLARLQLVVFATRAGSKPNAKQQPDVAASGIGVSTASLLKKCQKTLPSYMVPDLIIPLTFMPLATNSGKSDSKLLATIFATIPMQRLLQGEVSESQNTRKDLNEAELEVLKVISSTLGQTPRSISPHTTAIELGLDSLSAITLIPRLKAAGFDCGLTRLLSNPTLEVLAKLAGRPSKRDVETPYRTQELLQSQEHEFFQNQGSTFSRDTIAAVRLCLPLQETIVAQSMHYAEAQGSSYISHMKFELDQNTDVARLQSAWEALAQTHEILRTCFAFVDDRAYQVVRKPDQHTVAWIARQVESPNEIDLLQKDLARDIVDKLFLEAPLRLAHVTSQSGDTVLVISIHHAIYDGSSFDILMEELQKIYHGQPSVDVSNAIMIEYITSQDKVLAKEHWSKLLEDWENAPLLLDQATENVSLVTLERSFAIDLSRLEELTTSRKFTLATLLQGACGVALARWLKTNDFIFGTVLSGRTVPLEDAEKITAPCVTTVPQRLRLDQCQGSLDVLLGSLQAANSSSLEFQHVSPRDIRRWVNADRPLYDCLVSFLRLKSATRPESGLMKHIATEMVADFPLALEIEANDGTDKLTVRAAYDDQSSNLPNINMLLEEIEMLVESVLHGDGMVIEAFASVDSKDKEPRAESFEDEDSSELGRNIKALTSEFTGVPETQIHMGTIFIQLGIDSLVVIRFAKFLAGRGVRISSSELLRHNRLGTLCRYISARDLPVVPGNQRGDHENSSLDDATSENREVGNGSLHEGVSHYQRLASLLESNGISGLAAKDCELYPCTPLQASMLTQSLATNGSLYMHHHAIRCNPATDLDHLKSAWESLVESVEVLRTTFHFIPSHSDPWIAAIHQDKKPKWTEIEVPDARRHWLAKDKDSDFMLRIQNVESLASVEVVRSQDDPILIFTLHHSIYDGISLKLMFHHLVLRYLGAEIPRITPFFPIARQIALNQKRSTDYWTDVLKGFQGILAIQEPDAERPVLRERIIVSETSQAVDKWRRNGCDDKAVCMVAFGKALAVFSKQKDVVFGHVTAARHGHDLGEGDIIGPTFNTVPIRFNLSNRLCSNLELVQEVRQSNVESIEYQHGSLIEIQKQWRGTASNASAKLMDSIFVYSKDEKTDAVGIEAIGVPLVDDEGFARSEVTLNVEVEHRAKSIVARVSSTALPDDVDAFLSVFEESINDVAENPSRVATAYPLSLRKLEVMTEPVETLEGVVEDDTSVGLFAPTIRAAMAELAGISTDKILLDQSIYSYGVDSIAAIKLTSLCRKDGIRMSVTDVLRGVTLRGICALVSSDLDTLPKVSIEPPAPQVAKKEKERETVSQLLGLPLEAIAEVLPCLAGQEYQILSWLRADRTFFEHPWVYRSTQALDVDRLKNAWNELRRIYTILRTTFAAIDPQTLVQAVLSVSAVENRNFSVHSTDETVFEATRKVVQMDSLSPSTFFAVPLRLTLVRGCDGDSIVVQVHHALYDGVSMPLLLHDLMSLYQGKAPPATPSFSSLVFHATHARDVAEENKYWKDTFADCNSAIFPETSPLGTSDTTKSFGLIESQKISIERLKAVASHHNIPPQHVILLGAARTIARKTSIPNPIFGFTHLGRSTTFQGIENVVGPCSNVLPLGIRDVQNLDVFESLRGIRDVLATRTQFEQSHLRQISKVINPETANPPLNVYVNILWHKDSLTETISESDLLQPLDLGSVLDFSSPRSLKGRTTVDTLDVEILSKHRINIDIAPGKQGLVVGVWADEALLRDEGVRMLIAALEVDILGCVAALEDGI